MKVKRVDLFYYAAAMGIFALLVCTYLLRPIMEPDFFWHLKTGEWIWQNGSLPSADPFTFTGPQDPSPRQQLILQGYWLVQLIYQAFCSALGLWGVLAIRVMLLAAFFVLLLWNFSRYRVNKVVSLSLITVFFIFFLENYALERPQVVTFLGAGMVFILYRWVRDSPVPLSVTKIVFPPFFLMTAWANMHGGVLVGQGIVGIILLVETVQFLRSRDVGRYKGLVLFSVFALIGSFLTPAHLTIDLVGQLMGGGGGVSVQSNYEFFSVYEWLVVRGNKKLLLVMVVFLFSILWVPNCLDKKNHVELLAFAIFWFFAFRHVRYVPIALVFSLLFVGWNYRPGRLMKYCAPVIVLISISAFMAWTTNDFKHYARAQKEGLVSSSIMPVAAADYLQENRLGGRILNTYNAGGYLMWRLYPQSKLYIDSRFLDEGVYSEFIRCFSLDKDPSGRPIWKNVVDKYHIDIALLPIYQGGKGVTLTKHFARDPEWKLVFSDTVFAVFVRNNKSIGIFSS